MVRITTIENKRKLFVKETSLRDIDKKYIVLLSATEDDAKSFEKQEAKDIIANAVNPFDRVFEIEKTEVKKVKRSAAVSDLI